KLERFIGSVLSIANAYFKGNGWKPTKENDLYLPNITSVPTEESIHVLISGKNHFMLSEIRADVQDFIRIKRCYTKVGGTSVREYVETLLSFSSKALKVPIPDNVLRRLYKLD
ncbi:MAG: hypothetical protein ACREYC_27670, partial [Gammaproteobacteria bacterium]